MKSPSNAWKNIVGVTFNYLTVLEYKSNGIWLAQCKCGNKTLVKTSKLNNGHTKSCGCIKRFNALKHNGSETSEYHSWSSMKGRCNNPNNPAFVNYGGRGITVCKEWNSFETFLADMGPCPIGYSIERINNNLGYNPQNCIWATPKTQNLNKRSNFIIEYKNKNYPLVTLCKKLNLNYKTVFARLRVLNWSVDKALTVKTNNK